jgi:hypothetical protein
VTSIVIEMHLDQRRRNSRGSLNVCRILPSAKRRMAGTLIFSEHTGPLELAAISHSVDATTNFCVASPT